MNKKHLFIFILLLSFLVIIALFFFANQKVNIKNVIQEPETMKNVDSGNNNQFMKARLIKKPDNVTRIFTINFEDKNQEISFNENTTFQIVDKYAVQNSDYRPRKVDGNEFFGAVKLYDLISINCDLGEFCVAASVSTVKE